MSEDVDLASMVEPADVPEYIVPMAEHHVVTYISMKYVNVRTVLYLKKIN